jgi:hypothetical protein
MMLPPAAPGRSRTDVRSIARMGSVEEASRGSSTKTAPGVGACFTWLSPDRILRGDFVDDLVVDPPPPRRCTRHWSVGSGGASVRFDGIGGDATWSACTF